MSLQDIKIKKRIYNIILGLVLGLLAMYLAPSCWSYFFYVLSALAFIFTDQIVKAYIMNAEIGHFSIKGSNVKMTVRDKDGNIKSQSK